LQQEDIHEAVVVAQSHQGSERLVAYVSATAGTQAPLETQRIQRALHESLPDYMVPGIIVVLDALPLTPNGKVDRKALPAPELANINTYEAPEGDTEIALAGIWQEV
ncbi:hypothetical protein J3L16_16055, partial [Alteromonas sp. 5E99-2]|uniref:AMP-binding enzyme n=1 Tax=Alteromonas sp. 5E99-2 TaxID=2817683 RepID=UPI001A98B001